MDPCASVIDTCELAVELSASVSIDESKIASVAQALTDRTHGKLPLWDEGGWHYHDDIAAGGALTAQYILVLDAMNFCFWPSSTHFEYATLASGLTAALRADPAVFCCDRLRAMTPETLRSFFLPADLPNAPERAAHLREIGEVLAADFGGSALSLIARAKGSAVALVRLVNASFPSFRDEAVFRGRRVYFYKRSQIFVGDVWAAFGRLIGEAPGAFYDIGSLTCFADYRLPQLFRHVGLLTYSPELAALVDTRTELPPGSDHEIQIRAATVVAVEKLRHALGADAAAYDGRLPFSVEVDWLLWQWGEQIKEDICVHHRTNTVFY